MLQELVDPITRIKSFEVYVNDKHLEKKMGYDYIEDIEIEANYFRHSIIASFLCFEELFTLTIGQSPSAVNDKTTVRLVITDHFGNVFDRRFVVLRAERETRQNTKRSNLWRVYLEDLFGNALNSVNFTPYITEAGFNGTPLEIVTKVIETLFRLPLEVTATLGDPKVEIISKRNEFEFINDDNPPLEHRFSKDLTPLENILKIARRYNVHLYQDFKSFYIIQNPTFENVSKPETPEYVEMCSGKYPLKICDKIRGTQTLGVNERSNYRVSLNLGGKKQVLKELNFSDMIKIVDLNGNGEEFKDVRCDNVIEESSGYTLASTLLNTAFKKYITASNVVIYTRPKLDRVSPGSVTSISLGTDSEYKTKRQLGDYRFSGTWLIRSCTLKLIRQESLIGRLILCRFDNQADTANAEQPEVVTDDQNVLTNKPDIPLNRQEFLSKYANDLLDQTPLKDKLENLGSSPFMDKVNNAVQNALKLSDNIDSAFKSLGSFISIIKKLEQYKTPIKIALLLILPGASEQIIKGFETAITALNERLAPCKEIMDKCFKTLKEYFDKVEGAFKEALNKVEGSVKEMESRILNAINKHSSLIKSSLNGIIGEVESTIKMTVNKMCRCVKQFVDDFVNAMNESFQKEFSMSKTTPNMSVMKEIIKMVIDNVIIKPAISMLQDSLYGVLSKCLDPVQKIKQMVNEVLQKVSGSVTFKKVSIKDEAEKYISLGKEKVKDLKSLKEKRESLLRGLR